MPYISRERRDDLDEAIARLQNCLRHGSHADPGAIDGDLNYTFTRLLEVIPVVREGRWRYRLCNLVEGVLGCCAKEFYRRLAGPYEDRAIEKNGDVPLYEDFRKERSGG